MTLEHMTMFALKSAVIQIDSQCYGSINGVMCPLTRTHAPMC